MLQHILDKFNAQSLQHLEQEIFQTHAQLNSPNLQALKSSLNTVFPDITDIYLQYQPKLQLMLNYQGQNLSYQQLSNSMKTWIALVGDIVRRLCLLNPLSLYPCLEGEGIVLIDQIDTQLDQTLCREILPRLHLAFPRLQLIVTGNREELLEHAFDYQCLRLSNKQISPLVLENTHDLYDHVYQNLFNHSSEPDLNDLSPTLANEPDVDQLLELLAHLTDAQKQEILQYLQSDTKHLNESRLSEK